MTNRNDKSNQAGQDERLRRKRTSPPDIGVNSRETRSEMRSNAVIDCGWGRLIFGQTFEEPQALADALRAEAPDRRDMAIYIQDPHVILALAPQELFLDPSHTLRLDLATYRPSARKPSGFFIRRLTSQRDADEVNRIYATRHMVTVPPHFFWQKRDSRVITYFVAEDERTGDILGTVTGVDHYRGFGDVERGSSLWCLAVDPQAPHPGMGEALTRHLAEHFLARGAAYMDLSVMHDNEGALGLYDKLGFSRVHLFTMKRKNPINEKLFTGPQIDEGLNPYAKIIVDEARRRGIHVEVTDAEGGFFRLTWGGQSVHCRESLSELTSGVAVSICDDKSVTRRMVEEAGVRVPEQLAATPDADLDGFLARHPAVVVKPARGEQGRGVVVGIETREDLDAAIANARKYSDQVLIEEQVEGEDLRLVVIDYRLVAAAVRRVPQIVGDGKETIRKLIEKLSARREAATGGESRIPLDAETERCVRASGYEMDDILPSEEAITVRKTANLHTGGMIYDVTGIVHPRLVEAAVNVARAIDIPVVGVDFMVKDPRQDSYAFIEANERPGLANHEPQPTAERFIDLLFPLSVPTSVRTATQN